MADHNDLDPIKQAFLDAFPNPQRIGCPDRQTLKAIARRKIPLDHPAQIHVSQCSPCFKEVLAYQTDWENNRRWTHTLLAATAVFVLIALAAWWREKHSSSSQPKNTSTEIASIATRTVDLWDVGTFRGEQPTPLHAVSLPASLVRVNVILPRFSVPGKYRIAVAQDQAGNDVIAEGTNSTAVQDGQAVVKVVLDLRHTKPGAYFLSTTREHDEASNFYPLHVG